jgi:lipopolysaccharide biosynthesis regulator YciM
MKIPNAFRLSLRDLFWATALIAVGLGWYLDHRRAENRRRDSAALSRVAASAIENILSNPESDWVESAEEIAGQQYTCRLGRISASRPKVSSPIAIPNPSYSPTP